MKKVLTLAIACMFIIAAAGWNFNVKKSSNLNSQKSQQTSISSVDNTSKVLSYTNLNAPKAHKAKAVKAKAKAKAKIAKAKKPMKKLIHKSKTLTKKTVHKVGKKTITTIETTPVKP
jgi:hypothetical protein